MEGKKSLVTTSIDPVKDTKVYCKTFDWYVITDRDYKGNFELRAWAKTKDSDSCLIRVQCTAELFLELDADYEWDEALAGKVALKIGEILHTKHYNHAPVSYEFVPDAKPFYGAYIKSACGLRLFFSHYDHLSHCKNLVRKPMNLWPGQDSFEFVVHDKVDALTLGLIRYGWEFSGWLALDAKPLPQGSLKISRLPLEYLVKPSYITVPNEEVTKSWNPIMSVLAVDIECNAENTNAMPKPFNPNDTAFLTGCIFRGKDGIEHMHVFCCKARPKDVLGVTIHYYPLETDAIKAYSKFIVDVDPDIILTHNGMGFDEEYLWIRYTKDFLLWPNDSRLLEHKSELIERSWDSSAYSNMSFKWVNRPGRLHVDLLPITKRTHRLDSYALGFLGKRFLGTGKLTGDEDRTKDGDEEAPEEDYLEYHRIFEAYRSGSPEELKRVLVYCVGCLKEKKDKDGNVTIEKMDGDCGITLRLYDKLQTWLAVAQMAKVAFVPPFWVYTRGQQIRTFNQTARLAYKRHIFMNNTPPEEIPVKGGKVFEPKRGLHHWVYVFDFKGLYPSIIRANNYDHTTYVPNTFTSIPDEDCTVKQWEEEWYEQELQEWKEGKKKNAKKKYTGPKIIIKHKHRWLKTPRGIMPDNLDVLARERAATCARRDTHPKGSFQYNQDNNTQEGQKVVMNSAYGGAGAKKGRIPHHPLAACVTYDARCSATLTAEYLEKHYNAEVIYGDTDSVFVIFPETWKEEMEKDRHGWGKKIAKEVTKLFPNPMELEYEKLAEVMLLVNKKQYAGFFVLPPKTGPYVNAVRSPDTMMSRGIMSARRDNATGIRTGYIESVYNTLMGMRLSEWLLRFEAFSRRLMGHCMPEKEVTIIQKIGAVYKKEGNHLNVYRKHLVAEGKVINPGDRIPYVFIEKEGTKGQGEKMELPELRAKHGYKIDYLYYLEKRGMKPFESILVNGYDYKGFVPWHVKYLKHRAKLLKELRDGYKAFRVINGDEPDYIVMDRAARKQRRLCKKVKGVSPTLFVVYGTGKKKITTERMEISLDGVYKRNRT
jgi:DNA polymerase elongation subunit (family B)